jgi:hypothetical protein
MTQRIARVGEICSFEELPMFVKVSHRAYVLIAFAFCALFLSTGAAIVKAQTPSRDTVYELKFEDQRIHADIDKLAVTVSSLAEQQKINNEKIDDLNNRVIWIYGTGGGAFGIMGFLQFIGMKTKKGS